MKIKKPEDEKYFKDIVLKDILNEISNETGAPKISESTQKKYRNNTRFFKILFFIFFALLFFFFVLILFHLISNASTKPKTITKLHSSTTIETENWKMEKDRVISKKTTRLKTIKVKPVIQNKMQHKTEKSKPLPKKKTERELAKEALLRQMKN